MFHPIWANAPSSPGEFFFVLIFFLVIPIGVVIRLLAGACDGDRIRDEVRQRGGEVLAVDWTPFGPGWFGSRDERIYTVRYRDRDGAMREATCKTSLFSGVYWTGDREAPSGEAAAPEPSLSPVEPVRPQPSKEFSERLARRRKRLIPPRAVPVRRVPGGPAASI